MRTTDSKTTLGTGTNPGDGSALAGEAPGRVPKAGATT